MPQTWETGAAPDASAWTVGPSPQVEQSSKGGLVGVAISEAVPAAGKGLAAFAASPEAPKVMGAVARGLTTAGGVIGGVATASPAQVLAASREGWLAGKGAYFLGKGLQSVSRPVANALKTIAPYMQTVGTLSGAQTALDVAQMAEPTRKDIGVLGVTMGDAMPDPEHPALLNLLAMKASDAIKTLVGSGVSAAKAADAYWTLKTHMTGAKR